MEQTEKTDQNGQERTYSEEQFKGLLADKQSEVRRRQEAEARISDLEKELEARKRIDPHAPGAQGEEDPDNRPLTMNDLVQLLGGEEPQANPQPPKSGQRAAGGPAGVSLPWLGRNRNKPVEEMSDAELDKLAEELV